MNPEYRGIKPHVVDVTGQDDPFAYRVSRDRRLIRLDTIFRQTHNHHAIGNAEAVDVSLQAADLMLAEAVAECEAIIKAARSAHNELCGYVVPSRPDPPEPDPVISNPSRGRK